jgi:hypothetical protein
MKKNLFIQCKPLNTHADPKPYSDFRIFRLTIFRTNYVKPWLSFILSDIFIFSGPSPSNQTNPLPTRLP